MIKKIKLTNFRQFEELELDIDNQFIIICGDNTKGKSTILESLYLLTNGTSPWGEFEDQFKLEQETDRYFRVEIVNEEDDTYTYFRDGNKRLLKINNRNTTSKKFLEKLSSVLFSPERIDLLMISSSKRREFLDHILIQIDIEYSDIISKYNKILKQRNAYLKRLSKRFYEEGVINDNDTQLLYWTRQAAKYTSLILSKRTDISAQLTNKDIEIVYKPSVTLNLFEDLQNVENLQEITYEQMLNSLKRDIATGVTNIGAHRDDWTILQGRDVKRFGSRGEKRVAIGKLVFQSLEIISKHKTNRPLLLIDDISSELDKGNTLKVLTNDILPLQQTILTTIDLDFIPNVIKEKALIIDLNSPTFHPYTPA